MALRDTWINKQNSTNGIDGDNVDANDINKIAEAVIELEDNSKMTFDSEMSDTSENAVQNKVVKKYVDDVNKSAKSKVAFTNGYQLRVSGNEVWVTDSSGNKIDTLIDSDGYSVASIALLARQAENDAEGNMIHETYATKEELSKHIDDAKKTYATKEETNNIFANTIKGSASGEIISITDISPIENTVGVKLSSDTITDFSTVILSTQGKNLINFTRKSGVLSGVTVTVNNDESITLNGTATSACYINIGTISLPIGTYFLSGCPSGGNASVYNIYCNINGNYTYDVGKGKAFAIDTDAFTPRTVYIYIAAGQTMNNMTFKPMVEVGESASEYEPHIEPTTYTPNADGTVDNVKSIYPSMTMYTDTSGVVVNAEYNADTKRYIDNKFAELQALVLEG